MLVQSFLSAWNECATSLQWFFFGFTTDEVKTLENIHEVFKIRKCPNYEIWNCISAIKFWSHTLILDWKFGLDFFHFKFLISFSGLGSKLVHENFNLVWILINFGLDFISLEICLFGCWWQKMDIKWSGFFPKKTSSLMYAKMKQLFITHPLCLMVLKGFHKKDNFTFVFKIYIPFSILYGFSPWVI